MNYTPVWGGDIYQHNLGKTFWMVVGIACLQDLDGDGGNVILFRSCDANGQQIGYQLFARRESSFLVAYTRIRP